MSSDIVLADARPEAAWHTQATTQDDNLTVGLRNLSQLPTGQMDPKDVLICIAEFAVLTIPGANGAGLSLLQDECAATAPFVTQLDDLQRAIGQGPCVTASEDGRTVHSSSLPTDPRWPKLGAQLGNLAVQSVLSLPLTTTIGILGTLNLYALEPDAFDQHVILIGELFAGPAAITVQNTKALAQANLLATQLQTALTSRTVIDQAIGIMMSRIGCDETEAFDRLRKLSQHKNVKLHGIAQNLVTEAASRARARHTQPSGTPNRKE